MPRRSESPFRSPAPPSSPRMPSYSPSPRRSSHWGPRTPSSSPSPRRSSHWGPRTPSSSPSPRRSSHWGPRTPSSSPPPRRSSSRSRSRTRSRSRSRSRTSNARPVPRPRPRRSQTRPRPVPRPRLSTRAGKIYDILNEKGNKYIGILAEQAAKNVAKENSNKRTFTYSEINDIKKKVYSYLHDWKDLPKEDAKKLFNKTSWSVRINYIVRNFNVTDTSSLSVAKITENEIV